LAEQTARSGSNAPAGSGAALTAPAPARRHDGPQLAAPALAGLLLAAGLTHFALPSFYEAIIPKALPGAPRMWVFVSGGAELACAAAVADRPTRRVGATLAALLFVVVFPANVKMAIDWSHDGPLKAAIAIARLPLQVPLIWWALALRHRAVTAPR
jgi:uncharacterized membrane protein